MVKKKRSKRKKTFIREFMDIPRGVCIFFIVVGIVLGNIFVIGELYWNKVLPREEFIPVTAAFDDYKLYHGGKGGSVSAVKLSFSDYDYVYTAVYTADLGDALGKLKSGDRLEMLLHPNSGEVWEIKYRDVYVLSLGDTAKDIHFETVGFVVLGIICYLMTAFGASSLIFQHFDSIKRSKVKYKR